MIIEIIMVFVLTSMLVLIVYNTVRMNNLKIETKKMSLIDLVEFQNLSKEAKEFYRLFVLETWIKEFNVTLNKSIEVNGLDKFYAANKKKLITLNNLYLDIAKLSIKEKDLVNMKNNVLIYNTDLDKLIKDANTYKLKLGVVD